MYDGVAEPACQANHMQYEVLIYCTLGSLSCVIAECVEEEKERIIIEEQCKMFDVFCIHCIVFELYVSKNTKEKRKR